MTPIILIVLALFALWFLASAANLVRRRTGRRIPMMNVFFGTPTLMLFESSPVDFQLFYRDRLSTGRVDRWQPAIPIPERSWFSLVWNPSYWLTLDLWYAVRSLKNLSEQLDPEKIPQTARFNLVQNYILSLPRSPESRARQFAIVRGAIHERTARVHFTSPFSDL